MFFSIIIVNYKTEKLLKNCLNSIFDNCDNNFEIIIIDNNFGDGSVEMLKNDFKDKINLLINNKNIGFGSANNLGAKEAKGDYLFFLNPDTIIKENIFQKIIEKFKRDPKIGVIAPQLILPDGKMQPWAYGQEKGIWQIIKNKFTKPLRFNEVKLVFDVDWVSGAALAVKKEVFKSIGGFDENFFMYFEDRDLCLRVKKMDYKIMVLPSLKVVHFCGQSLKKNKERKRLYYQSQNYFFKKHYGFWQAILIRFIRLPCRVIFWK